MMYSKALIFGDLRSAEEILKAQSPADQKALGREVSGFDESRWALLREAIAFWGNYEKFLQNPELADALLATGNAVLAEASPSDRVWGIGLAEDDPKALNQSYWRGQNLLGTTLVRVREALRWELSSDG